ncbi:MAG: TIGR03790 family protein [Verrucomicrobiota bacterium]
MDRWVLRKCRLAALFFYLGFQIAQGGESDGVVIVANSNEPDSIRIALYYAAARQIPQENIISLKTSTEETISLREYVTTIHNPLLEALLEDEWIAGVKASERDIYGRIRMSAAISQIDYLVTTSGIPLRFTDAVELLDEKLSNIPNQLFVNRAAVDSELALLAGPPDLSMTAYIPNPFFGQLVPTGPDVARVIRVSRLDGPSVASVKRLIDRTLEAEETGLLGRAYIDVGGPHERGDQWIQIAADLAQSAYFDTDIENTKRVMDERDRLDAPAIYMGWYRQDAWGPWLEPNWPVPPGAIGFHLHSFSATTVRSETKGWLGPFVRQGYCATVGNVYEPLLDATHRPHAILARLMEGDTFGKAVAYSNSVLSWQTVAIGDPLYRPFKVGLPAQLELDLKGPFSSYPVIREINRLRAEEDLETAIQYARIQFVDNPSLALSYRLGLLYEEADNSKGVVEALRVIRYMSAFQPDEIILAQKIANLLHKHGSSDLALDVYSRLLAQSGLSKTSRIFLLEGGARVALENNDPKLASRWKMKATSLKPPPKVP